jgi:hypothetical protein
VLDDRLDGSVLPRETLEHLAAPDHAIHRPVRGAADIHVFDEPHLAATLAAEREQRLELIVVDTANHDRVDLEAGEEWRGGIDALQHAIELVGPRQGLEAIAMERVEAHREAVQPGVFEPRRMIVEKNCVRRQREIADARPRREALDERRQIAAEERLAPGQANFVDAEIEEDVDESLDLLEMEDVLARQPHVLRFGHAVAATQVAAICH